MDRSVPSQYGFALDPETTNPPGSAELEKVADSPSTVGESCRSTERVAIEIE
jgi:hypothetical protein